MTVLTIFTFESRLMQMPGPRDIVIYRPGPGYFLLCKSPGAGHTFWCKSPGVPGGGDGNRSNRYLHNLIVSWHLSTIFVLPVWGLTYPFLLQPITVLQKKILKIMCSSEINAPSGPLFDRLQIHKLNDMFQLQAASFV